MLVCSTSCSRACHNTLTLCCSTVCEKQIIVPSNSVLYCSERYDVAALTAMRAHANLHAAAKRRIPKRASHIRTITTHHPQHHSPISPSKISPSVTLFLSARQLSPSQSVHHVPSQTYRRTITQRLAMRNRNTQTPKPRDICAVSNHQ